MDWLMVMRNLSSKGVSFSATWYGDGPELGKMHCFVRDHNLESFVMLAGFVADRSKVINAVREADAMVFCHLTPESPRNLIESLTQGTPIAGYRSAYSADLLKSGGGCLTDLGSPSALAEALGQLASDRPRWARFVAEAAAAGRQLTDEAVFRHRAELTRRNPLIAEEPSTFRLLWRAGRSCSMSLICLRGIKCRTVPSVVTSL